MLPREPPKLSNAKKIIISKDKLVLKVLLNKARLFYVGVIC